MIEVMALAVPLHDVCELGVVDVVHLRNRCEHKGDDPVLNKGETDRVTRVGSDTTTFKPGHVGMSKGILGQTRKRSHVDGAGINSRSLLQNTTSFCALEQMV